VLSPGQVRTVLRIARARERLAPRSAAAFALSVGLGLRAKELAALRWSDVFEESGAPRDVLHLNQLRIWRNSRKLAVENFVSVVGDKPVNELTEDDGIEYAEWWRGRVISENIAVKTANKDIGQLSRMLKDVSIRRRLKIPEIFKGLRLRGKTERSRVPFETDFIQNKLLATGALDALNEDARDVLYVVTEIVEPSEIFETTHWASESQASCWPRVKCAIGISTFSPRPNSGSTKNSR